MEPEINFEKSQIPVNSGKPGCSGFLAMIFISIWIMAATFIVQIVNWSLVQALFEGSLKIADIRWLVLLTYALILLMPLLIAYKVVGDTVYRARFFRLSLISSLALLLTISRLPGLTDWQAVTAIQIAVTTLFLLIVGFFTRNKNPEKHGTQIILNKVFLAAAAGGLLGIPWVLWGSQGSPTDSTLALMVSIAFGFATASLLITGTTSNPDINEPPDKKTAIFGAGWTITLGLMILTSAADQNGNGWILLAALLPLGFACAALSVGLDGSISAPGRVAAGVLTTLGFAWTMIMVDPDELSFVITGGTGELIGYVVKGAFLAFGLALLVMVVFLLIRKWLHKSEKTNLIGAGLFILCWVGVLVLYGFNGNPGFFGEKTFVVLKAQADLSTEREIQDPVTRREAVYKSLVNNAETTQKDLRAWLDSKGIFYKPYYLVNAIELDADPILRAQLAARNDIDRILDSPILRPLADNVPIANGMDLEPDISEWNINLIGADKVHSDLHIAGEGIIVGQSDSGAQGDHPEFSARYRGVFDGSNDYNWFDPWYGSTNPVDIGGHGTHTLGSIVGKNVGVAPQAEWIGCVNLARNLGNPALYLDCMQFMLAPFPQTGDPFTDGKPEKGANVLNNSWGCPEVEGCDPGTYLPAVKALRDAGVFVVASAGNSGYGGCSTVEDPLAIYEDVYSVGAIDNTGNLGEFSSIGPVTVDGSGRVKPDIVAPGVDILSSFPGSTYESNSGTSMAGPHVVGVVALMWSANNNLIGNIDRTREILNQTADPYTGRLPACVLSNEKPNNAAGYGVVNAYNAVLQALEDKKNNQ